MHGRCCGPQVVVLPIPIPMPLCILGGLYMAHGVNGAYHVRMFLDMLPSDPFLPSTPGKTSLTFKNCSLLRTRTYQE